MITQGLRFNWLCAAVFFFSTAAAHADIVLRVDISDFLDNDPNTNNLTISGVNGAFSTTDLTVTQTGNFPIVGIEGLFVNDKDFSNFIRFELTESLSGLQDFMGNPYGNLHVNERFCQPTAFPPSLYCLDEGAKSLGMLNTTRSTHRFSTTQTAFTGSSTWDLSPYNLTINDFNRSGEVTAQAFTPGITFIPIGQWESIPPPASRDSSGGSSLGWLSVATLLLIWSRIIGRRPVA